MIGSEKEKDGACSSLTSSLYIVNFIQVLFNYFNLCKIIRHFDWSAGLIRRTGPKKVENISTSVHKSAKISGVSLTNYNTIYS